MALNKDKIFKAADKAIRANKIEKAIKEYETWLNENPKDWNVVRQVGDLYSRVGRRDEAIKKYSVVAEHFKRDGFNVRAIATHKMILRLDSHNESAMRNLAELQAEEGLLMEAKSHFQTLVELYTKQGHKKRAAEVFKKLSEIDPQDVKIRYKYAEFLSKQGKADEASREYVGIADQFIGQGLVDEAVKILEQGRSLATSDPVLKVKLAQAHSLQGNHAPAITLLEEVRGTHPNDPVLLGRLGEAYLGAGNMSEAESVFQKLQEVDPQNPDNTLRLADLRIAQSKFDDALQQLNVLVDREVANNEGAKAAELLQRILSKEPYHVKSLLKLAEVHTILKHDSGRVMAYDSLCEAYHRSGDSEKAVHVAEQLVELEPENAQHKDRLKFLKSKLAGPPPVERAQQAQQAQRPQAPAPEIQIQKDIPDFDEIAEVDLSEAVSEGFEAELTLDDPESAPGGLSSVSAEPIAAELGEIIELTQEDEENIREKLTEAEVFVKYGLVDKAISQLLDVLESFRFHIDSRAKLVEIYKEQNMAREASEQLMKLAQVYDRLGRGSDASQAREEATELNPALAAETASAELAAQEELELTLAPESDSDLGDVGLDLDAPSVASDIFSSPSAEDAPVVEEAFAVVVEDDNFAIDASEDDGSALEISLDEEEFDVSVEPEVGGEDFAVEVDLSDVAESSPEVSLDSDDGIEMDLDPSQLEEEEIPISMDVGLDEGEEIASVEEIDDFSAPLSVDDEEEFSVEFPEALADDDDDLVALPEAPSVDDLQVDVPADVPSVDDIEIDIPAVNDMVFVEESEDAVAAIPVPPEEPVLEPRAAPSATPSASGPASPLAAELAEVDEYIAMGLYEDARDTLHELLKQHPGDEAVAAKLEELGFSAEPAEAATPVAAPAPGNDLPKSLEVEQDSLAAVLPDASHDGSDDMNLESLVDSSAPGSMDLPIEPVGPGAPAGVGEQFIDLASELSDEIFGTQAAVDDDIESDGPMTDPGLDQIFKEFRKGVEKQLGAEDYDTRYNLGIAYKEMGLTDEAIAEFQLAAKDELRGLECCSMLGLCFMEKGMPNIAIKWFSKGLGLPGRRVEEYQGLRYDLAQAHQAASEPERALELYMEVYKDNARFRDVKDRVRELQATQK